MKGKKNNNNLKSFFPSLKDPCASVGVRPASNTEVVPFSAFSVPWASLSFLDAFYHEFWSFQRALSLTDSRAPFYHDFSQNHEIFSALFIQFSRSCFCSLFLAALPLSAFFLLSCCSFSLSLLSFVIFWLALLAFCSLLLLSSSFVVFFLLWLLCRLGILIWVEWFQQFCAFLSCDSFCCSSSCFSVSCCCFLVLLCWLGIFPIKVLIQSFCFSFFSLVFSVDPAPLLTLPPTLPLLIFVKKQTLPPQLLKHLSWCPNPLHLLSSLPSLRCCFQTCISITNSQTWGFYHGTLMVFTMMKNSTFAVEWLQVAVLCLFCFKKPMPHLKKILIISRIIWGNICGSKTPSQNGSKALPLESEEWKASMI